MPSIVQFIHPGPEHGPDNPPLNNYKGWNIGQHRRKFLCSDGDYIENGHLRKGELMFWGEWEAPSNVQQLNQNGNTYNPSWLHSRIVPNPIPVIPNLQNTDPFIFENEFKFLLCQQFRPAILTLTQLANLDTGSLILFGSLINKDKPTAFFQLDTVFVVNNWIDYNPLANAINIPKISQNYFDIVYTKAYPSNRNHPNLELRLYRGATIHNRINGMYSFVPARLYEANNIGFPRIPLRNMPPYMHNNKSQGFKITNNLNINAIQAFWDQVVLASQQNGCVEGVRFY